LRIEQDFNEQREKWEADHQLDEVVDVDDIAEVVNQWTGIPLTQMMESETEKLLHMEERLHERIIGQDEAVIALSRAVKTARVGLKDPRRPIGSFMFLGPTGVGKTELAKALAEFMFGSEDAMLQLDMSEYMDENTVSRLIGAPPGYVGYEEGGYLTETVRRRPYSVILMDEIEKAHPDVFNILLQVLDDGRLTDGHGRTVDFKNTIIVMTSNIGSAHIQQMAESGADEIEIEMQVKAELKQHFRPEFINRVDDVVVFHPLSREHIRKIVDIQLGYLHDRLADRDMRIHLSDAARDKLAEAGFDPVYGARPLKRAIQQQVENPLAQEILQGKFKPGDVIEVGVDQDRLDFQNAA